MRAKLSIHLPAETIQAFDDLAASLMHSRRTLVAELMAEAVRNPARLRRIKRERDREIKAGAAERMEWLRRWKDLCRVRRGWTRRMISEDLRTQFEDAPCYSTIYNWLRAYQARGPAGLIDGRSTPRGIQRRQA